MPDNPNAVAQDPTNPAVPTNMQAVAGVPPTPTTVEPGTSIPIPTGQSGIETLTQISPPFRSNAPKWFTPKTSDGSQSVWSRLGCAVAEPGRYIQTSNTLIWAMVDMIGREMFHLAWQYPDRLFDRWPSMPFLYNLHKLVVVGRNRLIAKTTPDNSTPLQPTHSKPNYQMFKAYPIPLFGPLGSPNTWIYETFQLLCMLQTEAMQHSDNALNYYYTQDFFTTAYPYLQYVIVDIATRFFGVDVKTASADGYQIPETAWATYNPQQFSVSTEGTASRTPIGDIPTDLDLEPIRGLPYSVIVPFLQPWPDSRLLYSSGGIWADPSAPASTGTQPGSPGTVGASAQASASALMRGQPPA